MKGVETGVCQNK